MSDSFDTTTRFRLSLKLAAMFSLALLIAASASSYFFFNQNKSLILKSVQTQLSFFANTLALSIDGDAFQKLNGRLSLNTPEYRAIHNLLEKSFLTNHYLGIERENIYLFRKVSDNELEFSVMLYSDYVGNRYAIREEMKLTLSQGSPSYTAVYNDSNGSWVSAYAPIRNSKYEIVGLLEVDFKDNVYLLAVEKEKWAIFWLSLLATFIGVLLAIILSKLISIPIVRITNAAIAFSKGDFNQSVQVHSQDEIGTLARAFNFMVLEIKQKFQLQKFVSDSTVAKVKQSITLGITTYEKVRRVILFSDVRGFTTFVESNPPEESVKIINEYLGLQAAIVKAHNGDVDKFVGDQVMAVFQSPGMIQDALNCARSIQLSISKLKTAKKYSLDVGIGVNVGLVVEGTIGSKERVELTVIGDAVNVASRLCSQAQAGETLVSHEVYSESPPSLFTFLSKGEMRLKGKSMPLAVYALAGADSSLVTNS